MRDILRDARPQNLSLEEVAERLRVAAHPAPAAGGEGSGFRNIKEATRRDIAYARLAKTCQPIARIAAGLSYADPSTFYRAFVAWSGMSPEQFRHRLAGNDSLPRRLPVGQAPCPASHVTAGRP